MFNSISLKTVLGVVYYQSWVDGVPVEPKEGSVIKLIGMERQVECGSVVINYVTSTFEITEKQVLG